LTNPRVDFLLAAESKIFAKMLRVKTVLGKFGTFISVHWASNSPELTVNHAELFYMKGRTPILNYFLLIQKKICT
jgi:hypothetical protein